MMTARCDYAGHGVPADYYVCAQLPTLPAGELPLPASGEIRPVCADHVPDHAGAMVHLGAVVLVIPVANLTVPEGSIA